MRFDVRARKEEERRMEREAIENINRFRGILDGGGGGGRGSGGVGKKGNRGSVDTFIAEEAGKEDFGTTSASDASVLEL